MSRLKIGTRVDCYELIGTNDSESGQGQFGITYKAKNHGREDAPLIVALKEYFPNTLAHRNEDGSISTTSRQTRKEFAEGLKEFKQEAEAIYRFDGQESIVQVYEFLEANKTGYIVMEWIEGMTLAKRIGSRTKGTLSVMTIEELKPMLLKLLDALDALHSADPQQLHRDIKPLNIMLRRPKRSKLKNVSAPRDEAAPVLIDFGAARQITAAASQRLTTILTPGYAPYEQYVLSSDEAEDSYGDIPTEELSKLPPQGPYTDIYALAAVCHYALTGGAPRDALRRKFEGAKYAPLAERLATAGTSPGDIAFLRLIDKALEVEPDQRPQSARAWRQAILEIDAAAVASPPPEEQPPPVVSKEVAIKKQSKGGINPFAFAAVLVAIVGLIGFAAMNQGATPPPQSSPPPTPAPAPEAIDAPLPAPALTSGLPLPDSEQPTPPTAPEPAPPPISPLPTPTPTPAAQPAPRSATSREVSIHNLCDKTLTIKALAWQSNGGWIADGSWTIKSGDQKYPLRSGNSGTSTRIIADSGDIFLEVASEDGAFSLQGTTPFDIGGLTQRWVEASTSAQDDQWHVDIRCEG